MSIPINIEKVTAVLIGTSWHDIHKNTFDISTHHYEFESEQLSEDSFMGFSFQTEMGETIAGPLSAIIAVSYS